VSELSSHAVPAPWGARPLLRPPVEATGGRHAFDEDAELTPIFTELRVDRPRPVPHPADDSPTMLLPVVPALYAVPARRTDDGRPPQRPTPGPRPYDPGPPAGGDPPPGPAVDDRGRYPAYAPPRPDRVSESGRHHRLAPAGW
jgi:hypothetical protein